MQRFRLLLALSTSLLLACGSTDPPAALPDAPRCEIALPAPEDHRLVTDGALLRDALGRVVFLRGVNAGGRSKFAPFVPFDFEPTEAGFQEALDRYLDRAASFGVSALRVPFVWAAVEPTPGMDDETFLARYDALLDGAWKRRIWTIIDFHQDIYSDIYCGSGFPGWTVPGPNPEPRHDCPDWFIKYSQDEDVRAAFDAFWSDEHGARTAYRALWERVAARHAGRPGVLGYEPINEPHQGTADLKTWEKTVLTPFYTEMAALIRAKDPTALVFFDATGTDAIGAFTYLDKPEGEGLVFAPHWYDYVALFGGVPSPSNAADAMARWADKGREWNMPVLVGESGASWEIENLGEFVTGLYDAMDENALHFTYWEYSDSKEGWNEEDLSLVDYEGQEVTAMTTALVRPYPRAVAGEAPSFRHDAAARRFVLAYDAPVEDGVTEIVVPERSYPEGYRVELSNGCVDTTRPGLLLVRPSAGQTRVELSVVPR
ncbi:cellulase family glycosylhydrolase [Polyangium spumosum]|uniref:cellulase family glycosylhydrolase n=1 Tax=Polyangium spumosum TaxID=889282 RepID=UPI00129BD13E